MNLVDVGPVGVDHGLGPKLELFTKLIPLGRVQAVSVGKLDDPNGRAERRLRISGLGGLKRCAPLECGVDRPGPDLADDEGGLLASQSFRLLLRETSGNLRPPEERELLPGLVADHVGPGMRRGNVRDRP